MYCLCIISIHKDNLYSQKDTIITVPKTMQPSNGKSAT